MKEIKPTGNYSFDEGAYPASLIQRQFWVLHSFAPDSPAYNIPLVSVIEGFLDPDALESAFNTLLRKYRIFRATFDIDDSGELIQRFGPWQKRPLPRIDLRPSEKVPADNRTVEQALTKEIQSPFDLAAGPLLRFKLFRTGEQSYILAITVQHIVFDLATSELFAQELATAYFAALKGQTAIESIETEEYAQFSKWQERWLKSDEIKKMEAVWKLYLEGAEPSLKLPFDRPSQEDSTRVGAILPVELPGDLNERITAFCRKEAVIPFLVLLTAWSLTLARLSSQNKLTVGVPLTNRRKEEFKKTMGCFVNILPLVLDLSGNPTMGEILRQVRMAMLKMHRMQEIPYYRLVQMTRHAGTARVHSLFQAGFTFEQPMQLQLEGVDVKPKYIHHGGAQLDLFGKFWLEGEDITGVIEYDSGLFDASTIKRIRENFLTIINEVCGEHQDEAGTVKSETFMKPDTGPAHPLSEITPLSDKERHQLVVEWNNTKTEYPGDACIHQLFEDQAYRTPEAIAIEFEGQRLTYAELDARSSQFAEHLQGLGVVPEMLVALYVDRSLEMVIALLGILKAGGAYLPLDRIFPRERLAFMLQDANPPLLVTLARLREELPPHHAEVVCVDAYTQKPEIKKPAEYPSSANLAYILYTSGSTGQPKGVEIPHRALVNFLTSMREVPGISAKDTLLSVTTISFDILGLELWLPLISGAKVVIVPQEVMMDGKKLSSAMTRCNATMMQATPATWRILLESGWEGNPGLKILCGGEAWSNELAGALLPRCGSLWNMYGPTETTIWSAVCQVRHGENMSLGRPIANTQFYVVDSLLRLVPVGVPGELLIGGDGLARGYLNRPALTAEKFIPNPFSANPESRLYRTGDTVRYLPDGKLEFVGRLDQQVKIRGYRIELGDIESALGTKAEVKQAVVLVHEDKGEKYLAAYIVPSVESKLSIPELRSYLKMKIPAYMVPSQFFIMPDFPLTPNGKIDRKALLLKKKTPQTRGRLASRGEIDPKIIEWNKTDRGYPLEKSLQSFIEAQVFKSPDAPALTYKDETLSYKELNERVNRLAHFLQAKGIGPEILVGVLAFRSVEMVIALLAIVKAGGAYVPFDPTYPAKRLSFMINDSKVRLILAQKACSSRLDKEASQVIYFEDIGEQLETFPATNPPIQTNPDNLTYVIYTSGTTGHPKGVMNTHKGIVNRLLWMQETFQIDASDALLQKTPFSFDVSVWEFFWPFMCGARLVLAKPEGHKDADYLLDLISREKITVIHFVPSMLRWFLEKASQERCASLRHVILSGEALKMDLQRTYFNILKAPLYNLYGPTEAAVDVSYWQCDPLSQSNFVPIGRPISNTKLYVLDESTRSVPVGESGELHIGGVQVARGYLNHPELTAGRFIQDPFSDEPSARLYKTGDLCRFLPDGNIEFLGRMDFQVKIRGNRVELGEVEEAILRDPSVKDCAVMAREDTPDEQQLVAYVVENEGRFSISAIREKLAKELPGFMIPTNFVLMPALHLLPNGKIDRLSLPEPNHKRPDLANKYIAPQGEVERIIVKIWQDLLPLESVGLDDNFFDLGGHSLLLVRLANRLHDMFYKEVPVLDLFQYPTVREQARLLRIGKSEEIPARDTETQPMRQKAPLGQRAFSQPLQENLKTTPAEAPEGIAVIGMAGRFPGAPNVFQFWENLRNGVESIRHFTTEELAAMGLPPEIYNAPNFVKAAPMLADADMFDASFFGYSPKEAEIIDPQQRLFLECAWNALENAGYDPGSYTGKIGAFGGAGPNYYGGGYAARSENHSVAESYQWELGNENDYLTTRVAYKLGLRGPSLTVQTACSTSMVATHIACQNLLTYQCDMALAGGVSINALLRGGYFYQEGMIPSPDGHCRAFDSSSQGTVLGQGVGVVVLKRLSDAVADADRIYAVIRGSAINNDGAAKIGFTAPSVVGQSEVILAAQSIAGVSPEEISYIETHGTGTPLGDPIEIKALTKAFRLSTDKQGFCAIGSVKTNIGHLDAAAGITGLIKTILMLVNKEIPPSLHFEKPNPNLDLDTSPFFVNTKLQKWQRGNTPRRAGVSSFGLGGTNAHLILEEPPILKISGPSRAQQLLLFSARTEKALDTAIENMASYLGRNPESNLADVAFTLQTGRKAFAYRGTVVCRDVEDAVTALRSTAPRRVASTFCETGRRDVVFMFSGQGSQYANMGLELYKDEPVFREQVDYCSDILQREMSIDLRQFLFPAEEKIDEAEEQLKQTFITQPALFTIEFALAKLWMSWGISPQALVGHSIGEYTAACLADVFSLEDVLKLVAARGRLIQEMPPGCMLAVFQPEAQLAPFLNSELSLSVINGPSLCVVAGESGAIDDLEGSLSNIQVTCRRLHTSHAFHSKMMDPVLRPFAELVGKIGPKAPKLPFLSNVSGTWIKQEEATDPEYWAMHLRSTVRFSDCIQELFKEPNRVLLEVGPGQTLSTLARQHPAKEKSHVILSSTRLPKKQENDTHFILNTLSALWRAGVSIDWMAFHAGTERQRVPLPTYPFEHERFWIEQKRLDRAPLEIQVKSDETSLENNTTDRKSSEISTRYSRPDIGGEFVPPTNEVEKTLAGIWQDILGIDKIGIHDSFLDLGGNSLIAIQVISRIQGILHKNITILQLFDTPTIAQLAEVLDSAQSPPQEHRPAPIEKIQKGNTYPPSLSQERLWFINQVEPNSPAYNIVQAIRIEGSLSKSNLQKSLDLILARQEVLRTVFKTHEGRAIAELADFGTIRIEEIEVDISTGGNSERLVRTWVRKHAPTLFNLEQGPLVRAFLFRTGNTEHYLVLIMHHIISDGWSMGVWMNELAVHYEAFDSENPSPLPDLPIQYSDYALWQKKWLEQDDFSGQKQYWKNQLGGNLPRLELPTDYPRPSEADYTGSAEFFVLPKALTKKLKNLAKEEGTSLNTAVLAAFMLLLSKYSGQTDMIVGSPYANRDIIETEKLIGFFLNMLPIRLELSPNDSFRTLIAKARKASFEALANKDVPFAEIVRIVHPERSLNYHPVFQVILAFQNYPIPVIEKSHLTYHPLMFDRGATEYDLALYMWEEGDELHGLFEYSLQLFQQETIDRMVVHFQELIKEAANDPERSPATISMLPEYEKRQLLVEWNNTSCEYLQNKGVHQLFEAQVEKTPEATAVEFQDEKLTYKLLDQRANQLANYLRKYGVGPDVYVGICVERSVNMVIGLLAILKAGGAYVPLDPEYPKDRLAYMLESVSSKVILSQKSLIDGLPDKGTDVVFMDSDWEAISKESVERPETATGSEPISSNNLAYVLFTSGSTGKPKGVQISHKSFVNLLKSAEDEFGFTSRDVFLALTTLSFDIAGLEIFLPLVTGGRMVIVTREASTDATLLLNALISSGATIMQGTPGTWRILLSSGWRGDKNLKILCGGEPFPRDLAKELLERSASVWNGYGPTETTVYSTFYKIKNADGPILIGRPVANTKIYILDNNRTPVPIGVFGELYIGGVGVARGYLNRPDLTKERFLADPFVDDLSARMYRTGDLVRYLPDGNIEYAGRLDNQVKVRGFRIELGEVEFVLGEMETVKECAVVAKEIKPGDARLIAFIVHEKGKKIADSEIREHLKKKLPDYMIPNHFVEVEHIPMTPSGKVDRKYLRDSSIAEKDRDDRVVEPETENEKILGRIWKEIIGIKTISVDDDFFDIGGHSLLAVSIMTEVEKFFGVRLPLASLIKAPNIREFSKLLDKQKSDTSSPCLVPFNTGGSKTPFFLIHSHGGNILEYHSLANHLKNDRPVYAFQSRGLDGTPVEDQTIEEMAAYYLKELRAVQPRGPYFLGGYCLGGYLANEVAQLLRSENEEVNLLVLINTATCRYGEYLPGTRKGHQVWYTFRDRLSLERDRMAGQPFIKKYHHLKERTKRIVDLTQKEIEVLLDRFPAWFPFRMHKHSQVYHLEQIAALNDRAGLLYHPTKPYDGKVLFLRAGKQPMGLVPDPLLGWSGLLTGELHVHEIPGFRQNMLDEPNVSEIAKIILEHLH